MNDTDREREFRHKLDELMAEYDDALNPGPDRFLSGWGLVWEYCAMDPTVGVGSYMAATAKTGQAMSTTIGLFTYASRSI